ncbi:MAG: CmcI family methyltransferase [Candidatus Omnitrophica bacterium]|nr:CmcI family methyltransferase [Candidatus Omnitrophota bacterium]
MEQNLNTPIKLMLELLQKELFNSTYFDIPVLKSPIDFWIYMEIIYQIQPDLIIEIGNFHGGSTLALAHILNNIGKGRVVGVDISHDVVAQKVRAHPGITLITGDACSVFPQVKSLVKEHETVLIIEDSAHTYQNTFNVLTTYSPLVSKGSYFIVEDSNCHHGIEIGPVPGPYEAIERFISENKDFLIDRTKERFIITSNPKGYLRRIS